MKIYLFNKAISIQHILIFFYVIAQMKVVSVSSELFGADCTSRTRLEHVTQLDFTTLKILFIYQ